MVAIVGPSGSGKTTIMNMITGIDRATAGTVTVDGQLLNEMSEEQLAIWRGGNVGIVFQFFQLLPTLTALENAMLPLDFARRGSRRERFETAWHNLEPSVSATWSITCRPSSRAGSSNALRLRGPSQLIRS